MSKKPQRLQTRRERRRPMKKRTKKTWWIWMTLWMMFRRTRINLKLRKQSKQLCFIYLRMKMMISKIDSINFQDIKYIYD